MRATPAPYCLTLGTLRLLKQWSRGYRALSRAYLANRRYFAASNMVILYLTGSVTYAGTGSVVCEFHFNAFNRVATGIEVVIEEDGDKMDIACAKEIANMLHTATGLPLRKVELSKNLIPHVSDSA